METAVGVGLTGSAICLLSMRGNSAFWSDWGAAITLLTVSSHFVEDTNISPIPDLKDMIPSFQFPPNFTPHDKMQILCHVMVSLFVVNQKFDKNNRYYSYLEDEKNEDL